MKKIFLILSILFLFGCSPKTEEEKVVLVTTIDVKKNLIEYYEKVNLYDLINIENGTIIDEDYQIDTKELGEKEISFNYKDINDETLSYKFDISIDDTTSPLIFASKKYSVEKNDKKFNLIDKAICGDNYDKEMKCELEGTYDINKVGEYPVKIKTTDTHGNSASKDTTVVVKDKIVNSNPSYYYLKDFIEKYKTEDTIIGIDVSSWQGSINWNKVKSSGVDAAIIRIAYGSRNKSTYDKRFKENIKNAKKAGIKVGIYYYSYAKDTNEAINQAKWIVSELKGETLDLPIAFDWEDWSDFMSYKVNFNELNDIANAFMKEIEDSGYKAMNYGSATYHEKVWNTDDYPTWLAYYTDNNDFEEDYIMWQVSSTGKVDGINGYVDLNVIKNTIFQ
jgi:GH25 family lysozyme M1 (1,4-beta-N-acetylmuramidase)